LNLDELEDFPANSPGLSTGEEASSSGGAAQFIGGSAVGVGKKEVIAGAVQ